MQTIQSTNNQIYLRSKNEILFCMFIIYRKLQRLYKNDDLSQEEIIKTTEEVYHCCSKMTDWINLLISTKLKEFNPEFFGDLAQLLVDVRKDLGERTELLELAKSIDEYFDFSFAVNVYKGIPS